MREILIKYPYDFIETRGIRWLRRPSASTANETPGLNETTLGLNFETPKNVKPQIYCPNLTETVIQKKKKCEVSF